LVKAFQNRMFVQVHQPMVCK